MITPGDRADLIVAVLHRARRRAGVAGRDLLTLGEQADPRAVRLVERLNTGLALLSVPDDSFDTVVAAGRIEPELSAGNPRKVAAALGAFEAGVDTAALADLIAVARSSR